MGDLASYPQELDDIRNSIKNYSPDNPVEHALFLEQQEREIKDLWDRVFDDTALSSADDAISDQTGNVPPQNDQDTLSDIIRDDIDYLSVLREQTLEHNLQRLGAEDQKRYGIADKPSDKPHYTVMYGNHRTASILILNARGEIDSDTVIGKIQDSSGNTQPLTVALLVDNFEDGVLHTSNSNSRGVPWIKYSNVTDIIDEFDIDKFFDPEQDFGLGITLKQVPANTRLAKYVDIVELTNETVSFSSFMLEQSYETSGLSSYELASAQDPCTLETEIGEDKRLSSQFTAADIEADIQNDIQNETAPLQSTSPTTSGHNSLQTPVKPTALRK